MLRGRTLAVNQTRGPAGSPDHAEPSPSGAGGMRRARREYCEGLRPTLPWGTRGGAQDAESRRGAPPPIIRRPRRS